MMTGDEMVYKHLFLLLRDTAITERPWITAFMANYFAD